MQLYIIRHAESENNALWAKNGSDAGRVPEPDITEIGHQQARLVAQHLAQNHEMTAANGSDPQNRMGYPLTHLYSSLMIRAVKTGLYIAGATGLPLTAWEEIHEWGGIFTQDPETEERIGLPGNSREYFAKNFPDLILPDSLGEDGWWNRPFEREEQRQRRARQFLLNLLERHGDSEDNVAIVSHGGFIFSLLQALTLGSSRHNDLGGPRRVWFKKNNTAISRISFRADRVDIMYLNDVRFLPGDLIT